jgi:hypothetical protein
VESFAGGLLITQEVGRYSADKLRQGQASPVLILSKREERSCWSDRLGTKFYCGISWQARCEMYEKDPRFENGRRKQGYC